ncbi:GNAT family N-acetyltransferase [Marinimicrobium agarilyticum]|uniref:GNAT family N-acetyltransferase n=1 Tax=Marinimicrobium agarilyticum TaxID=306546 RepID=UPI000486E66A|nr:GNAT family N-acetyltransferase [Marinimicrobium agarilyticum]
MATLQKSFILRKAEPKDAEAIGKVRVAAWRAAYREFMPANFLGALDPADNLSDLKNRLSNQNVDFTVSVAEERDDVVAFSIVGKPRYETDAETLELWAVNVLPECWRTGIGSGLVERAINYSSRAGFKSTELWCIKGNTPAQEAYKKLGFVESGQERSTSKLAGIVLHELHYVKTL